MAYTNTYTSAVPATVTIPDKAVGSSALMGNVSKAADNAKTDYSAASDQSSTAIKNSNSALLGNTETNANEASSDAAAIGNAAYNNLATYTAPGEAETTGLIKGASTYQDPANTVASQLSNLLSSDNPYMQAAKVRAEEKAQQFGLLGSSMAVGAAHRAAIESGLPIAQQDAETAAKFGLQQQAAENQIGVVGAESAYNAALMNTRIGNEMRQDTLKSQLTANQTGLEQQGQLNLQTLQSLTQLENQELQGLSQLSTQELQSLGQLNVQELQSRWNFVTQDATTRLEASLNEKLQAQKIDADIATAVKQTASEVMQNHQISVEKLLADPDFLKLGATTVKNTINNMLASAVATVRFTADSAGVNLDSYLASFKKESSFTATVNPPATSTATTSTTTTTATKAPTTTAIQPTAK